jgi:hypothetical protein
MPRPACRTPSSVVAALLLAACGDASRDAAARADSAETGRGQVTIGTTTTLDLAPNTVGAGEEFIVRFGIRNDAPDTLRLVQSCDAPARVAIRAAGAAPGSPALETTDCAGGDKEQVVPPGASVVLQFPTRAAVRSDPAQRLSRPLEPGVYVVEATPTVKSANGREITISAVTAELRVR